MQKARFSSYALVVSLFVALSIGCTVTTEDDGDDNTPAADGGNNVVADGGNMPDAGNTPDAGNAPDAGGLVDAGTVISDQCDKEHPLYNAEWAGFCEDRLDDNCIVDAPAANCQDSPAQHRLCITADEPCPATAPASAAPVWDCSGDPPANVVAYARFTEGNAQVTSFCSYVYESSAVADEFYVAVRVVNGNAPDGPTFPGSSLGYCTYDFNARRHLWFTHEPDTCPEIRYSYPDFVSNQVLSNTCRKMIRNVGSSVQGEVSTDNSFAPDIQFFASSAAELDAKLDYLTHAEVGCLRIDNIQTGQPYRPEEVFYIQASAPIVKVTP